MKADVEDAQQAVNKAEGQAGLPKTAFTPLPSANGYIVSKNFCTTCIPVQIMISQFQRCSADCSPPVTVNLGA